MTVNYDEYSNEKKSFFRKHDSDFNTHTSEMDEYGRYSKEYVFKDGAVWYELMGPEYAVEDVELSVKGISIKTKIEVKLFKTEFWSTESCSKYYYEKY